MQVYAERLLTIIGFGWTELRVKGTDVRWWSRTYSFQTKQLIMSG
jgi:hypothetical protein